MLLTTLFTLPLLILSSTPLTIPPRRLDTRIIANVTVPDTPIIRSAEAFARRYSSDFVYKHIMRSWLFGVLLIRSNSTLLATVDLEIHSVATLLHDLGWDRTSDSAIVSPDRRFEVDGAIAAADFIRSHDQENGMWDERRVQLVWDAIALHTERSIAYFKEEVVRVVSRGISLDFTGPGGTGVEEEAYDAVVREFPKEDLKAGVNETLVWLCQTKPATTYDTWMQPWGERYVEGYKAGLDGKRRIDGIFANL